MVRLSTLATSTFTSALKVLSTVLPDSTFFSLDRTTAPPLPGLWCWNQMTCQSWPSRFRTMPFFRSLVVAMRECLFCWEPWARRRRPPGGRPPSLVRRPRTLGIRVLRLHGRLRLRRSAEPAADQPDRETHHDAGNG